MTVLKADLVWPIQPPDYYWTPYVAGRLDVRSVPGDHHSMFYPEPRTALGLAVHDVCATLSNDQLVDADLTETQHHNEAGSGAADTPRRECHQARPWSH